MPEWVHVWYWLRSLRHPQVLETFPQQERPPGNPEAMSMDDYDRYRDEWLLAGAPRITPEVLVAAVTQHDPLKDPVPF